MSPPIGHFQYVATLGQKQVSAMKITYAAATSLDGFIAKEDGDVSWLDEINIDMKETGLEEFFADIDGLAMGRKTYDFVHTCGYWPYKDKPTWVFTRRELSRLSGANLILVSDIDEFITDATETGIKHLWLVGGGVLASSFLNRGLITNLSYSEMPIRLGAGLPLFAMHKLEDIEYESLTSIQKNGFRQIEMELKESSPG